MFYQIELQLEKNVLKIPDRNRKIGQLTELKNNEFDQLKIQKLFGTSGYFEILDHNDQVLFCSQKDWNNHYTEKDIDCIPTYNTSFVYFVDRYETEDGKDRILLSCMYVSEDQYRQVYFQILDGTGDILYSSMKDGGINERYTQRQLNYLTEEGNDGYKTYQYTYINEMGSEQTLLIHVPQVDESSYRKIEDLWKILISLFAVCYIIMTAAFIFWVNKKVKLMQQEMLKEKTRILADISHDLKTPITAMQGYAKALMDGVVEQEQQQKYLVRLENKTEELNDLIHMFYMYNKLEHPDYQLNLQKIDIVEYVRSYLADKYEEIELQGFRLEVNLPEKEIFIKIDSLEMKRVLDNMIGNTMMHNEKGICIHVELKEGRDSIMLLLGDDGSGIPHTIRKKIFEPFVVGDEARGSKGSGLGMAVVKQIVEKHGGKVTLLESERRSTVFSISLPIVREKGQKLFEYMNIEFSGENITHISQNIRSEK